MNFEEARPVEILQCLLERILSVFALSCYTLPNERSNRPWHRDRGRKLPIIPERERPLNS